MANLPENVEIRVVTDEMFGENAYIVSLRGQMECIIVDPGLDPDRIIDEVDAAGLVSVAILNTHGHADHIAGNQRCKERWPHAPLIIGAGDAAKLTDPIGNLSAGYGIPIVSPPADRTLTAGDVVDLAGIRWSIRETPGHSSGHIVLVAEELTPMLVLGGDVLFAGSVGRSDFPDSDGAALFESIRRELLTLPDDAVVLPGHGPATTIGREQRTNPFVGQNARFSPK